jgi:hypothetical protein
MAEGQIKPKLTPETVKKLEEVFAIDGTVEEACFYAEISKQTYYNWIKEFPEMAERFDALRQRPFLKARQTIVKALDDPNHAFKYLERKKKKEFGANVDVKFTGELTMAQILKNIDADNSGATEK